MKKTVGVKWGGLKVGILIMIAIAIMLWASLSGGGTSIFTPKATYQAYFRNVSGLVSGSPVWMAGVEVGNVRSIEFVNLDTLKRVRIAFTIKESVLNMVTADAQVQLGTIGFLGDKYVEMIPGTIGAMKLPEGSVIPTREVGSAEDVFTAAEEAITEAESLAASLDTLLARANAGVGTLGMLATNQELYVQMTRLASEMAELANGLEANQDELMTSVTRAANTIADVGDKLDDTTGTIGQLIADPSLYGNLSDLTARLDSTLVKINQAEGSLGLLVNDTTLYVEVADLLARSNRLIKDIQDDPKKYFGFSIF